VKHSFSHFFIPQERNNHRASLLKSKFLFLLIGFYLLNQSVIKFVSLVKPGVLGYSSEITAQKVLDQTNAQRQQNGLQPLQYNSVLSESATKKAQDMFANNYWAHNSPSGTTPWDFFKSVGYKYSVAGENLARDFYDTDSLIKAWMDSPTHRENMLNGKYQEIGIGVVNGVLGGVKTTLVVQHFGTPLNAVASNKNVKPAVTSSLAQTTPVPQSIPDTKVLSETQAKYISPLTLNKIVGLIIFALIIVVLFIDGFVTLKNNTHRLTGSTVGHIGFLLVILLFMLVSQQGAIF
jgi:hypothetical protein